MNSAKTVVIAGLDKDIALLRSMLPQSLARIRWLAKDPLDWAKTPIVDEVPTAAGAEIVVYVLSPQCGFSTQLKMHFAYVHHVAHAPRNFLLPVEDAHALTETKYFEFLTNLPIISLSELAGVIA